MPNKTALISHDGTCISYFSLMNGICQYADFFRRRKVSDGDNVVLTAEKEIEFVFAYFALHLLRAHAVILDPDTHESRYGYILSIVNPVLCIGYRNKQYKSANYFQVDSRDSIQTDVQASISAITENTVCDILFTTGTTGSPKGVQLTQGNILNAAININGFIDNTSDDIEVLALPLCHSFGLGRLRCCLYQGATLVLLGSFANLRLFFDCLKKYKATGFGMVPSIWKYIRKISGKRILEYADTVRYIEIGSAPMEINDKLELCEMFPHARICMHYGLTEASRSTFIEFHKDSDCLDSIGKASPNVSVKFFDENGVEVSYGVRGELCVRGKHVMTGYLNPESNLNCYYDDFFRTGDCGYADERGYLYLVGRKKELINIGGKKVSPVEVEDEILKISGIADCACIGMQDPNGVLGEVVKCYLLKDKDAVSYTISEIRDKLKGKMETYKLPVEIEYVTGIPYTPSGKKQRSLIGKTNG